jgi:ribonuclease P protein component
MSKRSIYENRNKLASAMLHGYYLRKAVSYDGETCYRIYNSQHHVVGVVYKVCNALMHVCVQKRQANGHLYITVSKKLVRQLHGNNYIKRHYKAMQIPKKARCHNCKVDKLLPH